MGLFKNMFPNDIQVFVSKPDVPYEMIGQVEGLYDYSTDANNKAKALEKAKNELKRQVAALNGNAIINFRVVCFPGTNASTIMVYGDAIKF